MRGLLESMKAIWPVRLPESLVMKGGLFPSDRWGTAHFLVAGASPSRRTLTALKDNSRDSAREPEGAPAGAPGAEPRASSGLPGEWSPDGHEPARQAHSVPSSSPSHTCCNRKNMTEQEQPRQWRKTSGILFSKCLHKCGYFLSCAKSLSHVQLFATPWTLARQAPLSVEFSR